MGNSTPPERPMYEQLADTPWITRNRELNTRSYDLLGNAIDNLNRYDQNAMQATVDKYANYQWDQLNRNYQSSMNKNLARNYGRLGTTGSSSGLYTTDDLQRYYNNLAGNVSSNAASLYNQLVNQEYQRRLSNLNTYNSLFNTSGQTAQNMDEKNWEIRRINADRAWQNDMEAWQAQKAATQGWLDLGGQVLGGALGSFLGPIGTMAGSALGGKIAGLIGGGTATGTTPSISGSSGYSGVLPNLNIGSGTSSGGNLYNTLLGATGGNNSLLTAASIFGI